MRALGAVGPKSKAGLWVRVLSAAAVVVTLVHLAHGGFRHLSNVGWHEAWVIGTLLAVVGLASHQAFYRAVHQLRASWVDEVTLSAPLVSGSFVVTAFFGEAVFPMVYLLLAALVSFLSRRGGAILVALSLLFDAVLTHPQSPGSFYVHALFLMLFASLYHVLLFGRLEWARRAENDAVASRIKEVEEHARAFRLISSGSSDSMPGVKEEEKWLLASVKEVEGAVSNALEMIETALSTSTCGVLLLSTDDVHLKLYDCRSHSEVIERDKIPSGEGLLGGVVKRGVPVRMHSTKGLRGLNYYRQDSFAVGAVLAVPLTEASGVVRGVLVADRREVNPFTVDDEKFLSLVGTQVLRAIEVERVMGDIRRNRDEKDKFFKAIEEMNRATVPEQVFSAVIESARQIASIEFCAVTLAREVGGIRQHCIMGLTGASGEGAKALEGFTFSDNTGLVANVVRYGTPLPGRDFKDMDRQVIFDEDTQVKGLSALKIFPLKAGDRILGTLVCGSKKKTAIDDDALRMLEVIAIQAAQTVLRASLYEQMEKMATTDGLTGLLNHRTFQARSEEALAHARRYNRQCSLLLTDIDHFKSVNDTYGHPIGDLVLKGVSKVLKEKARDTDIVARYGGEEFAIVMPETDVKGAKIIAERIREAVQSAVFQTEHGPLKVTLSLGIATCPENSIEKQELIDLADQCLYFAKRHGRNQSVTVAQMHGGRKLQAVDG